MDTPETLDLPAIAAAGINTGLVSRLPSGEWVAYKMGDPSQAVSFGYDGQDEQGQTWWTLTTYSENEATGTDSFTALTELLDRVAAVTR